MKRLIIPEDTDPGDYTLIAELNRDRISEESDSLNNYAYITCHVLLDNGYGEDHGKLNIEIFPNPAKEFVWLSSVVEMNEYTILSIEGIILDSQKLNSSEAEIDVSFLSEGIYFFYIETSAGPWFRKFVHLR